jgi:hypothetical protein
MSVATIILISSSRYLAASAVSAEVHSMAPDTMGRRIGTEDQKDHDHQLLLGKI